MCRPPAAADRKTGRDGRLLGAGGTHGAGRWMVGQGMYFRLDPTASGWHTRVARPKETPHRRNRSSRRLADVKPKRRRQPIPPQYGGASSSRAGSRWPLLELARRGCGSPGSRQGLPHAQPARSRPVHHPGRSGASTTRHCPSRNAAGHGRPASASEAIRFWFALRIGSGFAAAAAVRWAR